VVLRALRLNFLPQLGYFVLGYFMSDHAAHIVDAIRRPATRIAAGVTWPMTAAILAAYWLVPLLAGRSFETIAYPGLAIVLLAPPLSLAAFIALVVWLPEARSAHPVSRLVQACGLYAYGVYYLHPLILLLVRSSLTAIVGLEVGSAGFYVLAFPICSVATVFAVRQLARLPHTRYLV
jgi:peptidoglycan/LPS O-acetylase OafA/YrhL